MKRRTCWTLLVISIAATGCGSPASSIQASRSQAAPTRKEVAEWTPRYVLRRLGKPIAKNAPFKNSYCLQYDGIAFYFNAPNNIESDNFQSVVIEKQDATSRASEFMKVMPSGISIGCTPSDSISILGAPDEVEKEDEFIWHTYNHPKGDWRHYWLRFRGGTLELINISTQIHGRS